MRPDGIALEHHANSPLLGGEERPLRWGIHHRAPDTHLAGVGLLQPGDDAERDGLAAAAGPQQPQQLTVLHLEADAVQGQRLGEALGYIFEGDVWDGGCAAAFGAPYASGRRKSICPSSGAPKFPQISADSAKSVRGCKPSLLRASGLRSGSARGRQPSTGGVGVPHRSGQVSPRTTSKAVLPTLRQAQDGVHPPISFVGGDTPHPGRRGFAPCPHPRPKALIHA